MVKDTYTISEIAAKYGLSAAALNKNLESIAVIHKQDDGWHLNPKLDKHGYAKVNEFKRPSQTLESGFRVIRSMVWTEKGRVALDFLIRLNDFH